MSFANSLRSIFCPGPAFHSEECFNDEVITLREGDVYFACAFTNCLFLVHDVRFHLPECCLIDPRLKSENDAAEERFVGILNAHCCVFLKGKVIDTRINTIWTEDKAGKFMAELAAKVDLVKRESGSATAASSGEKGEAA